MNCLEELTGRAISEVQRMEPREFQMKAVFVLVAFGNDIKVIENAHHVNINPDFERYYKTNGQTLLKTFEDWEPGRCDQLLLPVAKQWGMEMVYKEIALLPILAIKNFAMETPEGRKLAKNWKDVEFTVEEFNFTTYCNNKFPGRFD
ncbi:unnamed protein product [Coregonus sp. 'balchen']|nr:unnamed protein product [Coregonus sp. 'balchen']